MATALDIRRNDQRALPLAHPFWITSNVFDKSADDKGVILFSFPKAGQKIIVHDVICEVIEAFAGGTIVLDIGSGTIATDDITTGGTLTDVDTDDYIKSADITSGTIGHYSGLTSDFATAFKANALTATARLITGAATTVPCVTATLTSDAAITAGKARVHMLISVIDGL